MPASDHSAFSSRSPFASAWLAVWSWSSWPSPRARALALVGAAATFALGCTPKIGDECTVSTNCSATGTRLCDITQPGGYCTIFNCDPDTCPEDSACINFGTNLSSVGGVACSTSQGSSPYQRSFCMANCGSDGDCRGGYRCLDLGAKNDLGAVLAEYSRSGKVCVVAPHQAPSLAGSAGGYDGVDTAVCTGYTGGSGGGSSASGGASNSDAGASDAGAGDAGAGDAGAGGI